jgi:hypothetical protein
LRRSGRQSPVSINFYTNVKEDCWQSATGFNDGSGLLPANGRFCCKTLPCDVRQVAWVTTRILNVPSHLRGDFQATSPLTEAAATLKPTLAPRRGGGRAPSMEHWVHAASKTESSLGLRETKSSAPARIAREETIRVMASSREAVLSSSRSGNSRKRLLPALCPQTQRQC